VEGKSLVIVVLVLWRVVLTSIVHWTWCEKVCYWDQIKPLSIQMCKDYMIWELILSLVRYGLCKTFLKDVRISPSHVVSEIGREFPPFFKKKKKRWGGV